MLNLSIGYIGIDPGITGAIGFLFPGGRAAVFDPPSILIPVGDRRRSQILEAEAGRLVRRITGIFNPDAGPAPPAGPGIIWKAGVEWAQAMPVLHPPKNEKPCPECGRTGDPEAMARQGAVSAFSYGRGFGVWLGVLGTLEIPITLIRPQAWKRLLLAGYATKDKDAARAVAAGLFPGLDLGRRKDQGRAEAILIAEARRRMEAAGNV